LLVEFVMRVIIVYIFG